MEVLASVMWTNIVVTVFQDLLDLHVKQISTSAQVHLARMVELVLMALTNSHANAVLDSQEIDAKM